MEDNNENSFCDRCVDDLNGTCDYSIKSKKCKYQKEIEKEESIKRALEQTKRIMSKVTGETKWN